MAPRAYQLGRREAVVHETRQKVIAAARAMIVEEGVLGTSLGEVARRADVARATVYYQFGSRRGLLEAVLDDALSRAEGRSLAAAYGRPDPAEAVVAVLQEVARFWAAEFPIFRAVLPFAAVDPDVGAIVAGHAGAREAILWGLVRRLEAAGRIKSGVSVERVYDTLWLLTSFAAFHELHAIRGRAPAEVAACLVRLAAAVVDLEEPQEAPQ
ncbi:MAG: TetR/AcrR family transcriptional regulator [Chloroflexota bacterium]|nr:TetR/AcrR family transcriptional regulator [Dehalococcoidia bacterium]MDW8254710.1 TetR/AcrR family transcriptional regulator [Chloroflexota bacterium]